MNFKSLGKEIAIDIEQFYIPDIDAKQHDVKSRYLKIKLYNQGQEFNVNDKDLAYKFFAIKPDGTEVFNNCTIENGYVVIELTGQTLAVPGKVKAELMVTGATNGEVLTTKPFIINVIKSINSSKAIESTNEYSVIMNLVRDLNEYWRIHRYHSVYDVKSTVSSVPINISEMTSEDSINVFLNGVRLIENLEYKINYTTQPFSAENLKGTWVNGDQLYFEFLRRVKGATTGGATTNPGVVTSNNVSMQTPVFNKNNVQEVLSYLQNSIVGGGDLSGLTTTNKTNLINSINELVTRILALENKTASQSLDKNNYTTRLTQATSLIQIPTSLNYVHGKDVLDVYIAGAKVSEGATNGYTLDTTFNTIVCNNGNWETGTEILLEVIKNK